MIIKNMRIMKLITDGDEGESVGEGDRLLMY